MKQNTTIIAISGSLKSTSANTNILRAMAKIAPENVIVKIVEGLDQLPHFNPETSEEMPAVTHFRNQIKAADGVIFSTPEYAFGVPGVLKNALDWLVSSGELNDKSVAAISVSPMHTGGDKALASLMLTLSALGTNTPQNSSLAIGTIKSKVNELGVITNPETLQELKAVLTALLESIN
ncbi:NAD(P)H-dependent FMN reductase [Flavobacterium sp. CG_23.5]|uniref:NADPH-dependent FMN reductase n=1 Tax=Flavobacterium sp. CG_23.5 TaxID=2760708 RepID=UPI001AE7B122|nr:NAD(P)H-dependent oxidoreductase [Flavobacterium sp. CG_23.5]MBP2282399.1 NAD(P)H-dependent FMN reductase [Flavobacterium sp. CG_23.5]